MAKAILPAPITIFTLLLLLTSLDSGLTVKSDDGKETWCVAKPSTSEPALVEIINFVCSKIDCSLTREGGPCFEPNTYMSHASVAMNRYFKSSDRNPSNCDFSSNGLIASTDPSYGDCKYD